MRFLCDTMLGTLAKWLRFLGYDTAYPTDGEDTRLLQIAAVEDRVLLTRDRELAARGAFRIESDDLDEQLAAVIRAFHLGGADALSRCSVCNGNLEAVPPETVRDRIPEGVLSLQTEFWRCASCAKVYWKGSHYRQMVERIAGLLLASD